MPTDAALLRARRGVVEFVDVPDLLFANVHGVGAPEGAEFANALAALYPVAYGVRFALRPLGVDEKVSPLEAQWWVEGDLSAWQSAPRDSWRWRAMIRLPDRAVEVVEQVLDAAAAKHPERAGALRSVRVERWHEGHAAQTLHVGPYATEQETIELLHRAIADAGLVASGHHHEIYLGDPRRTAPERLRTILRQPAAVPFDRPIGECTPARKARRGAAGTAPRRASIGGARPQGVEPRWCPDACPTGVQ